MMDFSLTAAYKTLNVAPFAIREEVRKAYHKLILHNHPDKKGSSRSAEFLIVHGAYTKIGEAGFPDAASQRAAARATIFEAFQASGSPHADYPGPDAGHATTNASADSRKGLDGKYTARPSGVPKTRKPNKPSTRHGRRPVVEEDDDGIETEWWENYRISHVGKADGLGEKDGHFCKSELNALPRALRGGWRQKGNANTTHMPMRAPTSQRPRPEKNTNQALNITNMEITREEATSRTARYDKDKISIVKPEPYDDHEAHAQEELLVEGQPTA